MRKNLFFIAMGFLALSLTACSGLLDLEPQASISDDVALTTTQNVQAALIGAYDAVGSGNAYGGSYMYLSDLLAARNDEMNWIGTFVQQGEVYNKAIVTTNSSVSSVWTTSYDVINRANNVLSALSVFTDEAERTRVEGEAKFLRGIAYYNLLQVFAKAYNDGSPSQNPGVPLITEPTRVIDESLQVPRSSVEAVYAQVLSDLEGAKTALPASNGVFANRYSAMAFLARVHLTMGNYSGAAAESNTVITQSGRSLETSFGNVFNQTTNGPEVLFAMQVSVQDGANSMTTYYAPTPTGRADIQILDGFVALHEPGDVRGEFFTVTSRGRLTLKYSVSNRNINVLRLAEMYLIRAESNFRLTGAGAGVGGVTPLADLNRIRTRAGLQPVESVDLNAILKERKLELAFEGHALTDLKRTQGTTSGVVTPSIPWNAGRLLYPIPNREMLVNPNLVQNPHYVAP